MKKLLSLALTLALALTVLAVPASAASGMKNFADYLKSDTASTGSFTEYRSMELTDGSPYTGNVTVHKFPKGSVISVKDPARYDMGIMTDPDSPTNANVMSGVIVPSTYEFRVPTDNQVYQIIVREGVKNYWYVFIQGDTAADEAYKNPEVVIDQNGMHDGPSREELQIFDDVGPDTWYFDGVNYCYNTGMMTGVSETRFDPDTQITRAMAWVMLARVKGIENTGGATWYEGAQKWAKENGISDGTNPTAVLTREELMTMMYRHAELNNVRYWNAKYQHNEYGRYEYIPNEYGEIIDLNLMGDRPDWYELTDTHTIAEYAKWPMEFLYDGGVYNGTTKTTVSPKMAVTRAQAAVMFMNYREAYADDLYMEEDGDSYFQVYG